MALTNWAGTVTFSAAELHRPATLGELCSLVSHSHHLRVLGTGHSFNEIADSRGDLVSTAALPTQIDIDSRRRRVVVSGATRYGVLGTALQAAGFALANTGSLPHISVAGASSTGTHGSGDTLGNLSTLVSAVELVTADGEVAELDRDGYGDRFGGMVLALGMLGVITTLTLDIVPTYQVRQDVYDDLPHGRLLDHLDEIMGSAYSVSAFSNWQSPRRHTVWRKSRVGAESSDPTTPAAESWLDATLASSPRHPLAGQPVEHATAQLGVPGPWNERLPHFRLDFTPSSGAEIQSEYLVPRVDAVAAVRALDDIADSIASVLQIAEIRTVAADDLWISPSHGVDTVGLHFTWIRDEAAIRPVVQAIEERIRPLRARPHWGKRFFVGAAELAGLYPRLGDFRALVQEFDAGGTFRNDLVDRLIFGVD